MDLSSLNFYQQANGFDSKLLYRNLGSFWTMLFQERDTLKGYTHALVEEKIQQYISLIESINRYSIKDCSIYDSTRWKPILIYKSKYNQAPFIFEKNSAEFGPQSSSSTYYEDIIFRFGYNKSPTNSVYLYSLPEAIHSSGVVCDKVINPSVIFHSGLDIKFDKGIIYFNTNIFSNPSLIKTKVVGETGIPETYTDTAGNIQEEEFILLWAYHANVLKEHPYIILVTCSI